MPVAGHVAAAVWIVAADLVPWWFAMAFWISFVILAVIVVRDVRRVGGPRALWRAMQRAIDERGADRRRGSSDDPAPDDSGEHHPS